MSVIALCISGIIPYIYIVGYFRGTINVRGFCGLTSNLEKLCLEIIVYCMGVVK